MYTNGQPNTTDVFFDIDGTITPNFIGEIPSIPKQNAQYINLADTSESVPQHTLDLMKWAHGRADVTPYWYSARSVESREKTMVQLFPESLSWSDTQLVPHTNSPIWWKVRIVMSWLDEPTNEKRRLVIIDDDLSDCIETGEMPPETYVDERLLVVSPDHVVGLTLEQATAITRFARTGRRPRDYRTLVKPQTDPNAEYDRCIEIDKIIEAADRSKILRLLHDPDTHTYRAAYLALEKHAGGNIVELPREITTNPRGLTGALEAFRDASAIIISELSTEPTYAARAIIDAIDTREVDIYTPEGVIRESLDRDVLIVLIEPQNSGFPAGSDWTRMRRITDSHEV